MSEHSAVMDAVKKYILEEFLPGEDPELLTPTTPLMSSGILDSLSTLKLTLFLEKEFKIEVLPHEASQEHFDTLEIISSYVASKGRPALKGPA
jgi:acyl carrier protein